LDILFFLCVIKVSSTDYRLYSLKYEALEKFKDKQVSAAIEHPLIVERQLNESLKSKSSDIKDAEQRGQLQERAHYSKVVMKNKAKDDTLATKVSSLTSRAVSAELQMKKAYTQVNRSTKRADDVNDHSESLRLRIKELESQNKQLQEQVVDLEVDLEEKNSKLIELECLCPIKVFGKVRHGQRGATSWPYMCGS
jgi:chromosome segregation ATPase